MEVSSLHNLRHVKKIVEWSDKLFVSNAKHNQTLDAPCSTRHFCNGVSGLVEGVIQDTGATNA